MRLILLYALRTVDSLHETVHNTLPNSLIHALRVILGSKHAIYA